MNLEDITAEDIRKFTDDLIEQSRKPIQQPWLTGTPAMVADILLRDYANLPPELRSKADEILDADGPVRRHFMEERNETTLLRMDSQGHHAQ